MDRFGNDKWIQLVSSGLDSGIQGCPFFVIGKLGLDLL
jgi:hypothetical protein